MGICLRYTLLLCLCPMTLECLEDVIEDVTLIQCASELYIHRGIRGQARSLAAEAAAVK